LEAASSVTQKPLRGEVRVRNPEALPPLSPSKPFGKRVSIERRESRGEAFYIFI
jgi:hypothetical protein